MLEVARKTGGRVPEIVHTVDALRANAETLLAEISRFQDVGDDVAAATTGGEPDQPGGAAGGSANASKTTVSRHTRPCAPRGLASA